MNGGEGRPLRFLVLVCGCWIGLRLAIVWNATGSLPAAARAMVPVPRHAISPVMVPSHELPEAPTTMASGRQNGGGIATTDPTEGFRVTGAVRSPTIGDASLNAMRSPGEVIDRSGAVPVAAIMLASVDSRLPTQDHDPIHIRRASRLSVSGWMIARRGIGLGAAAPVPQLGGTQGGIRIDYAVAGGFAASGRIAAPAQGIGKELSIGIAWRPSGVPIRILAERRFALDRGKGGPALGISSGISDVPMPAMFRLDGYAQAGAIVRFGIETYVDASVRAARPLADVGGITLDVGAGAWGGAQRGVARLDVGPSVGARVPIEGSPLRVSLDWRQRVAGNARPGSGPAVTLGTDF